MSMMYMGIDLRLFGHPVKKDIFFTTDITCVNNSLKMIVNTNFYETPFNSEFGSNVRALLFELADDDTASVVKDRIINTIEKWEPRVVIENVTASVSEHTLVVSIYYRLQNRTEVTKVDVSLRLNR
jgi:phage baseplate assembly protein W